VHILSAHNHVVHILSAHNHVAHVLSIHNHVVHILTAHNHVVHILRPSLHSYDCEAKDGMESTNSKPTLLEDQRKEREYIVIERDFLISRVKQMQMQG